ncbi:MFS drug transporter [Truncatella angustata]|uniref:MFS drug transporter n=1 Tax=Truncatella angustata TaxID=152316 RepID=A0A9P8UVL0_9PEZI|nr:MFS drug transporter [Truncatella angustata]KAH6659157.1 MFS drug transporter [Truncatella angustata]KAH8204884.1 hypothetical protein TruAng_000923 [Truncatella angustata]
MDTITTVKPTSVNDASPLAPSIGHNVEALDIGAESPEARSKLRTYSILASLCLVLFVSALDQTIIATSIPTISASLNSASGYVWIGGAYLLANAAAGPIWARCSDIWGRKLALLSAIGLFAVASIIAAVSSDMPMLIAARALQGTAGGGLISLVTITISDLFSVRKRALFIGLLGAIWAIAGSAGPLIGGALTQLASWRWCFWINLPVCAIAFLFVLLFLDVHDPRTRLREGLKAIDWFGTFCILGVTLLLLLGLDFGGAIFPWDSPKVICLLVFGVLMIGFFLYSERSLAKYPLMHLGIFKDWSNNAILLLAFAHSMVSIGVEYYLPLYFQSVKQESPLRSGILILPMLATEAATDIVAGVVVHTTGRYRELVCVGAVLMTLGTGLYVNFGRETPIAIIAVFEIIGGIGVALLFQTPLIALQAGIKQADTSSATATIGLMRNVATSFSIVLGGAVFQNSMDSRQSLLAAAGLDPSTLYALSGDHAAANVEIIQSIEDAMQRQVVQDTFSWSLRNMFIMYTCIAAVALATSMFIKQRHLSTEHSETKTGIENLSKRENSGT